MSRSEPRSVNAGQALDEDVREQDDEDAEADDERQQQEDLQGDARHVGLAAAEASLDGPAGGEGVARDGHQYCPPHAPHERLGREVEEQGEDEQQEADEEEALEGELGTAHLVRADGERGHRRGHRLALLERIELEQRPAGPARDERDDHRLADRSREREQERGNDAGDGGRERRR